MTLEPAAAEPASEPAAVTAVSIILVTRNRAAHLKQTLEAISKLSVPPGFQVELVVVDNASTDETAQIVSSVEMGAITLTYLYEAKPGKLTACNSALAVAKGAILVWTDDDVVPPQDWIGSLCLPILRGEAVGVVGKVRTAPHLEREWMTPVHYGRLSDTRFMEDYACLIGANMAFHRDVLQKVPEFDPELGPGKLCFMDDSLFSFRLWDAPHGTCEFSVLTARLSTIESCSRKLQTARLRAANSRRCSRSGTRTSAEKSPDAVQAAFAEVICEKECKPVDLLPCSVLY